MSGSFRPCILVPTCNHVLALPSLLRHAADLSLPVLIVDDGSAEGAARALDRLVDAHAGVRCLRHDHNQGKGAAVLSGLREMAALGFSHAYQIDADGQHDLAAMAAFLEAARAHPAVHTLSCRIPDSMCGFRIYPVSPALALADRARLGQRMDFDIEILVRLHWAGTPIAFLPVKVIYPQGNVSNFRPLRDNIAISWMHTRLCFGMLARFPRILRNRPRRIDLGPPGGRHWADQRERGTYWGLRILAAIYRRFGRQACMTMMVPVVAYFFATGREQRLASASYLRRLHAAGYLPRMPGVADQFRHFLSFGAASLDKVAAWSGNLPRSMVHGIEDGGFAAAKSAERGAVVLTAHLGNPEVIRAIANLDRRWRVNVLVGTAHAERFNRLIARFAPTATMRLIQVTDLGVDEAMVLKEAVERGEWVVSVADRVPIGQSGRVSWLPFLGEPAPFPQGPFILAALLKAPVFTMFCLRDGKTYRVWFEKLADRLELPRGQRGERLQATMELFVARLEERLVRAPLQWYNFYDFWRPSGFAAPSAQPSAQPERLGDQSTNWHGRGRVGSTDHR
jgi:predicted LPLAT superfamily acyltransferase